MADFRQKRKQKQAILTGYYPDKSIGTTFEYIRVELQPTIAMRTIENVFQGAAGQIDLLNTLYGGSSQTLMRIEREDDRMVINLSAPGVSASSFNVLVEGNKLIIYTLLVGTPMRQDNESIGQRLAVPMFLKVMDIPPAVDAEQIEAVHEHGNVTVVLPYKSDEKLHRRVEIQDLF